MKQILHGEILDEILQDSQNNEFSEFSCDLSAEEISALILKAGEIYSKNPSTKDEKRRDKQIRAQIASLAKGENVY